MNSQIVCSIIDSQVESYAHIPTFLPQTHSNDVALISQK